MPNRAISRLAREMRSTHRKTRSWQKTAEIHNITNERGIPSKGLAYRIAMNGFEPSEHETLLRLGLPCHCDTCRTRNNQEKKLRHAALIDMRDEDIIEALKNRREMKVTYNKQAMDDFIRACNRASKKRMATI